MREIFKFMKQEYIENLQSWRIWNVEDLGKIQKSSASAKMLMQNYMSRGLVSSVRRNLFAANDLATGLPIPTRYEIGSRITPTSYISYHSALEYHGFAQQLGFVVYVASKKKFRPFSFNDYDYQYCQSFMEEGVINPMTDTLVSVTNVERTIVDCVDRIDLAGGWEEMLSSLEMIYRPDFTLIELYLKKYGKKTLYAKMGLMAEYFSLQWNTPKEFITKCSEICKRHLSYFTAKEESRAYNKTWNIYVPQSMQMYMKKSNNHEII